MKTRLPMLAACAALAFSSFAVTAHAADDAKPKTAQQEKMVACNKQAEGKKGDDRKSFMKDCLSAKPAAPVTQQDKMKSCNKQADGMKGDERKNFMSSCLKKAA